MKTIFLLIFLLLPLATLFAQEKRNIEAKRCTQKPIFDGFVNDAVWKNVPVANNFFQESPYNGDSASFRTEVKFLYDNNAIYIAAMMYDSAPDSILSEMGLRDNINLNSDYFQVSLAPYNDGINSTMFRITISGVQCDGRSGMEGVDLNWNGIWSGKTQLLSNGWSAELVIPYSDLRFPEKDIQLWGLNIWREIRRYREVDSWNFIDNKISGIENQAGLLSGISSIDEPLRLAFLPYLSGNIAKAPHNDDWLYDINYGLDLKWGINESFTLDMTLIPDFGQVRSDDQIYNLTPFEIYFDEQRAFFTEGTGLFEKGNIFYSRRIGKRPVDYDLAKNSVNANEIVSESTFTTPLFNATKISGRTNGGLGIGFLNALTQPTYTTIRDTITNTDRETMTQDWTNYNMFVLDQTLPNNSYVSFYNSNVNYFGFYRMANITGTQFALKNKKNSYSLNGLFNLSQLYYSNKNDLGYKYNLSYGKTSGNFRYNFSQNTDSDNYDPNDMGFNRVNNRITNIATFKYNFYNPRKYFLSWNNSISLLFDLRYKPIEYKSFSIFGATRYVTHKRLYIMANIDINPVNQNDFYEARTDGRVFVRPPDYFFSLMLSPDYRKKFVVDLSGKYYFQPKYNESMYQLFLAPRLRVNNRMLLVLKGSYTNRLNDIGYVDKIGNSIVFGSRNLHNTETVLETSYIFTPKIGIDFRLRHYWLSADYTDFYDLLQNGEINRLNHVSYDDDFDFNFNTFSLDVMFSWEFSPGSSLSLLWRNSFEDYQNILEQNYYDNLNSIFENPTSNSISLKLLYYLDYNNLRKKS